jgi:hypothetical protein
MTLKIAGQWLQSSELKASERTDSGCGRDLLALVPFDGAGEPILK